MIGQRISDRYEIIESIGGGGMANVYLALDVILDRHVAVKVLQPQFSDDDQFIKRFRREAQSATSLAHPNIVNIFDVGEEDQLYYIVMEYVKGQTLKELIQQEGPLPVEVAIDFLKQILAAMAHAHANQIVHRDIKPHNILISENGEAKVADFGIARAMSSATITHTNSVMGSVHYLSPEQARGGHITYRSDIYSLGIVLYEMMTGILPFSGDTAVSIAIKHLQNDMPSVRQVNSSVPQSVENMIQKATMKDPGARYQTAEEMAEDAYTLLDSERLNETPYDYQQQEDDEVTKAIPIVGQLPESDDLEKTIAVESTKPVQQTPEKEQAKPIAAPKKKKKRKKWLVVLILAAIFTLIVGATAFAILPNLFRVAEVQIPDVVDQPVEDAQQELEALNLTVDIQEVDDDSVDAGHVVTQNPRSGSTVKEGSTVRLQVSGEEEEVELGDYEGMPIEQAKRLLELENITVEEVTTENNNVTAGTVIRQTPAAGTAIMPSSDTVYLTYAVESQIRLRNLVGDTEDNARSYFNDENLRGRFSYEYSDSVDQGRIISQEPEPFEMLDPDSDVEVVVSRGQEGTDTSDPDNNDNESPDNNNEPDEEEASRIIEVSQPVEVSEEEKAAGEVFEIQIVFRDVTTDGEDEVFIEEEIDDSKTYVIPLRVSASQTGSFDLYINGQLVKNSEERTYE